MQSIRTSMLLVFSFALLVVTGCSDSGNNSATPAPPTANVTAVEGAGTKGPLANAAVEVFQLDPAAEDLRGTQLATGTTNSQAAIQVSLANAAEGLLLVDVRAIDGTTDLTTGQAPVLTHLSTVVTAESWLAGQPVYATPLTHLAVEIAARNVGTSVESALALAQQAVRNTFGFGLLDGLDIFTTPPLLTADVGDDEEKRQQVLRYRRAVEGIVAVLADIAGDPDAVETLFDLIVEDLASGEINGTGKGGQSINYDVVVDLTGTDLPSELLARDPDSLPIPKHPSGRTVAQVSEDLNDEKALTGSNSVSDVTSADDAAVGTSSSPATVSGLTSLEGAMVEITVAVSPESGGQASGGGAVGLGTQVIVQATAADNFSFVGWQIDGADPVTDNPYSFVAEANMNLLAVFEADSFELTLTVEPELGGSVTGAGLVPFGSNAELQATPADGFSFVAWENSQGAPLSEALFYDGFVMPAEDITLVARFELALATVEGPEGSGFISISAPSGHVFGEQVTYTATAQPGFLFVKWTDGDGLQLSDEAAFTFTLDASTDIRAVFEVDPGSDQDAVWNQFNWNEANWQ